jgi:nucleotide-binding universal stress UspA family protein
MLVLMALLTTFMTTPLLGWVYPEREMLAEAAEVPGHAAEKAFTVLVSVAFPRSGQGLMSIASAIIGKDAPYRLYALHLIRTSERPSSFVKGQEFQPVANPLQAVLETAQALGKQVRPLVFFSNDPTDSIVDAAGAKGADLILLGWHKPIFGGAFLGGTVRKVMDEAKAPVVVFIDRGLGEIRKILVPIVKNSNDRTALDLAKRIAGTFHAQVTLLHLRAPSIPAEGSSDEKGPGTQFFSDPETQGRVLLKTSESSSPVDVVLEEAKSGYDLVVIGISEEFELEPQIFGIRSERIAEECPVSMLIVRGTLNGKP